MTQRIEPFLFNVTQKLNPFSLIWRKETNFYFSAMTQSIVFFLRNWTFFNMTQRIEHFLEWLKELNLFLLRNMTQRIEPVCQKKDSETGTLFKWLIELNLFLWTSFHDDSKSWSLFSIWLIELNLYCFPIWLEELNLFFSKYTKNWTSLSYELLFWIWLKELNLFFEYDSKKWASFFFEHDSKKWTFFWNMTQRIEQYFW